MRIGIDVDGTVYRWADAVNKALAEQFGITGLGEHTSWDYLRDKLTREQWRWVWSSDAAERVFGQLDMAYPQAVDVVNALANVHEVHFVTHRNPYRTSDVTGAWLRHHFRNYRGVHVMANSCAKWELGRWDVFIDDKPETVAGFLAHSDALTLMPARPWNGGERMRSAGRFHTFEQWDEVAWLIAEAAA